MAKLVTREADNDKALGGILLIESFQSVVLRSESALGGCVHNQENLSLELGEVQRLSVIGFGRIIIDSGLAAGAGNGANGGHNSKYLLHGREVTQILEDCKFFSNSERDIGRI